MPKITGKDGTVYDVCVNLRTARRLVAEFNLDLLSPAHFEREPGLAFAADLALKIHLLDVQKNLREAASIAFDKNFTEAGELMLISAAVLGELASFFQRLGLIPEPPKEAASTGGGSMSTSTPHSPGSKTAGRSRSAS